MIIRVFTVFLAVVGMATGFQLSNATSQCLLGVTDDWDSSTVTLSFYEKSERGWTRIGNSWKARLGKAGLVWGLGLNPIPKGARTKREGDWKSPAGIFAIGGVWGYERAIKKHRKLPYRQITTRDLWVEDPESKYYNHHVVLDHEPGTAWEKQQQMRQNDPAHSLKLFIAHNAPPKVVKWAGSAIFLHIWRDDGGRATAGCTAMEEKHLRALIVALDPAKRPVYVLLPRAEYERNRKAWGLP